MKTRINLFITFAVMFCLTIQAKPNPGFGEDNTSGMPDITTHPTKLARDFESDGDIVRYKYSINNSSDNSVIISDVFLLNTDDTRNWEYSGWELVNTLELQFPFTFAAGEKLSITVRFNPETILADFEAGKKKFVDSLGINVRVNGTYETMYISHLEANISKSKEEPGSVIVPSLDALQSTKSNVDFYQTNYGVFGMDPAVGDGTSDGHTYWPRGSKNQYIFGSGFWFGAQKKKTDGEGFDQFVEMSYCPLRGKSVFSPGKYNDSDTYFDVINGDTVFKYKDQKYRVYRSTDFDTDTGIPKMTTDGANWPLWIDPAQETYHFGTPAHDYVFDMDKRNPTAYPEGPMFISDEDFVTIMHDMDMNRHFTMNREDAEAKGYPLGLQVRQHAYTWDNEEMEDVVILSMLFENTSEDTLYDAFVGYVVDADILSIENLENSAKGHGTDNDHTRYFVEDPSLNLGYAWSSVGPAEEGAELGYLGISLIETPAVDDKHFLRSDKLLYSPEEQVGISSFPDWPITRDLTDDWSQYQWISGDNFADDCNFGKDRRIMLVTGPINMLPGDKFHFAVALTFADPAKGGEPDGTPEDVTGLYGGKIKNGLMAESNSLIGKNYFAKEKYYEGIAVQRVKEELITAGRLPVFPNPASEKVNLPEKLLAPKSFNIYSTNGEIVLAGTADSQIDISELNSGMYLILIDGKTYKFIKE